MPLFTRQRFDDQALSAPQAPTGELACLSAAALPLGAAERWCLSAAGGDGHGAGRGDLGAAGRGGFTAFAEAALVAAGPPEHARDHAQTLARRIDGSHRLEAMPRLGGLIWRLRVLAADGRETLPADHPWDAGWVDAGRADHLARTFWPRRPTLVLAEAVPSAAGAPPHAALQRARDGLAARLTAAMADASRGTGRPLRAVRWLWVGAPEALATCAPEHAPRFNVD